MPKVNNPSQDGVLVPSGCQNSSQRTPFSLMKKIYSAFHILQQNNKTKDVLIDPPLLTYRRGKYLKDTQICSDVLSTTQTSVLNPVKKAFAKPTRICHFKPRMKNRFGQHVRNLKNKVHEDANRQSDPP